MASPKSPISVSPLPAPDRGPAIPLRSVEVLDLLDVGGRASSQTAAVKLPTVSAAIAPTTRPAGFFQLNLPAGQSGLSNDPASTVVCLPANTDEKRRREQAAWRQQRADADRQAAQTMNDSLLRVLLAEPPKPPAAATRPTIQLFDR